MEDGETGNGEEEEDRRKGGQGTRRGSRRSNRGRRRNFELCRFVISWLQMNLLGLRSYIEIVLVFSGYTDQNTKY